MWNNFVYILWALHVLLEVLPISSSGHMMLMLGILQKRALSNNVDYLMHIPTLLINSIFLYNYSSWTSLEEFVQYAVLAMCAASITAVCYFVVKGNKFPLWLGFLITSLLLFSVKWIPYYEVHTITFVKACIIGFVQGCALLPGISRLAATFVTGCWLDLSLQESFLFSLAIQMPLMGAAVTKALFEMYVKQKREISWNLAGTIVLGISTFLAYKLLGFVYILLKNGTTTAFAWYMLIPVSIALFIKDR